MSSDKSILETSEIVESAETGIQPSRATMLPSEQQVKEDTVAALARIDGGMAIVKKHAELLEEMRKIAIRLTAPEDWVLFRNRDGSVTGTICASGSRKVDPIYGINSFNFRPKVNGLFTPAKEVTPEGGVQYTASCDAFCARTQTPADDIMLTKDPEEDFVGRKPGKQITALTMADIRSSLRTGLHTKAVRILAAMQGVPEKELVAAFGSLDRCRKGSGFGTSTQRSAESVSGDDLKKLQGELAQEILRRVGGDEDAARKLTIDITKTDKFQGFDDPRRMTRGKWQFDNALKALREHPIFGDNAKPEPQK